MSIGNPLANRFEEYNELAQYWTDGKFVYYRGYVIRGADIETFEQYPGAWAKDKKYCYSGKSRLNDSDSSSFTVLSFAYAKDVKNVWTMGGCIASADATTFAACDTGKYSLGQKFKRLSSGEYVQHELFVPYGFAKDKDAVYYYNFDKNRTVEKAISDSFVSLKDGYFGYDESAVFCGCTALLKAKPQTWKRLRDGYFYSRDCGRIYYLNRLIQGADAESFEVVVVPDIYQKHYQYARDKNYGYINDDVIGLSEFEKRIQDDLDYDAQCRMKLGISGNVKLM